MGQVARVLALLWSLSFVTFALVQLLPGNAAQVQLGQGGTPADVATLNRKLGLDRSFLDRYLSWAADLVHGRLGSSLATGQPVMGMLTGRVPVSMELIAIALVFSLTFAVPMALLAARRPGGVADWLSSAVSVGAVSVTPFVVGIGLVSVFAVQLKWFPTSGFVPLTQSVLGNAASAALPSVTLALPLFGLYVRVLRGDLIDQMRNAEYILTARCSGASTWRVLTRHALRNALFGTVTLIGLNVAAVLGGTVVVEEVFGIQGVGSMFVQGIQGRDVPVVEAVVLLSALTVLTANRITDRWYRVLNRRVHVAVG
ncbi:ABC transporter permease [Jatrophihabitans telluris]|uniref:ABC transporter permease n=1 Tax=Jatrophihabitans telluris TaxID=2038343 RepID=A0ABY4QTS9_9ACTN|nr:ABC transporter permease [Jatrophihabitans telluris]UQX87101.1 ABC transporter permease [Jatrophihabitans telluris]